MMRTIAATLLFATGVSAVPAGTPALDKPTEAQFSRFLFFAVLEGLMGDGVENDLLGKILEMDAKGKYVNFVYACPICSPVLEAFRACRLRDEFYHGRKGDPYDDPARLPAELTALLGAPEIAGRREGLQKLVARYTEQRMKLMRLTPEERRPWNDLIAEGFKQGAAMLKTQESDLKKCPSCEGAAEIKPGR